MTTKPPDMLIIHGWYHWLAKTVAYRSDYCLSCDAPRMSVRTRTLDVVHLFFVPILPLGFWKRWHCATCGARPHDAPRTRRTFRWIGTLMLGLFAVVFSIAPIEPGEEISIWTIQAG